MASRYTRDQLSQATANRLLACAAYMGEQDAVPQIVIGEGHSGRIRSESQPVLWVAGEVPIEFIIATLEVALVELKVKRASNRG